MPVLSASARLRWIAAFVSLLSFSGRAGGDEFADAAAAAVAAFEAKDVAALRALAEKDSPDPWSVTDEIVARGPYEAALAFATAAPRRAIQGLPALVRLWRDNPPDPALRDAVRKYNEAARAGDAQAAASIAATLAEPGDPLQRARVAYMRAGAMHLLERHAEALPLFLTAADRFREIDAPARESGALQGAALSAKAAGMTEEEAAALKRKREVDAGLLSEAPKRDAAVRAADEALAAFHYEDAAPLRSIAARDDPDPWLVVDELCARGRFDVAQAFAGAAPRPDTEGLPAYVAGRRGKDDDRSLRLAMARSTGILEALSEAAGCACIVRALAAESVARSGTLDDDATLSRLEEAATVATEIGWIRRAALLRRAAADRAYFRGRHAAMVRNAEEHLVLRRLRGDSAGIRDALWLAGMARSASGELPRAVELQEEALRLAEAEGDESAIAGICGNLGVTHRLLGDLDRSLALLERSLVLARRRGDERLVAVRLQNIASVHDDRGDYAKALGSAYEALDAATRAEDRATIARVLGNLGVTHAHVGDSARAIECYQRSLDLAKEGRDMATWANALGNLAIEHRKSGRLDEALRLHEEALELKARVGNNISIAATRHSIGVLHLSLGSLDRAQSVFEEARDEARARGDRAGEARALVNLALVHRSRRELERARPLLAEALALAEEADAEDLAVRAGMLLAKTLAQLGRSEEALAASRDAVAGLPRLLRGLPDQQGAEARDEWAEVFETGISLAFGRMDPRELFFFLESGRALGLLESLGRRDALARAKLPGGLLREEALAQAALGAARSRYRDALAAGDRAAIGATRAELDAAKGRVETAISRIELHAGSHVLYPQASSLEEVQRALGPGDALVLYSQVGDLAIALVVTATDARIRGLLSWADIEDAAAGTDAAAIAFLTERLVALLGLAPDVRRVLVAPHGALAYVPFARLLPGRDVLFVPSGTAYLALARGAPRGRSVLALGDPAGAGTAAATGLTAFRAGTALPLLPARRAEAEAVGDIVLLGAEASEARLRAALRRESRWRAVHLACHGLLDREKPMFSSLALAPGDGEDGFLTAQEVFLSSIPADLVVLSACDTAKGRLHRAEGVVGFVRAFMVAGAPRVLVSLWVVDDEATRELMEKFYELWKPGEIATATALRRAQEHVASQERWKDPKYWAAWQLWGLGD